MNLLIVAATETEVSHYRSKVKQNNYSVDILITGAGMVATAFSLGQYLATRRYDMVLNVGVAGSFRRNIHLGTVVRIVTDSFSELGAEDKNHFLTFEEIGLGESNYIDNPSAQFLNLESIKRLILAKGITVNTVHGNEESIKSITGRVNADTESMEGAAVFYVANQLRIPVLQVRSISNYIEERNRNRWEIQKAIDNLNEWLIALSSEVYS